MNKFIRHGHKMGLLMSLALVIAVFALLAMPQPATAAGTTELTVTKYVYDSSGVISQMTVNYEFLYDNFEVMGDGTTRYYHQGPVFKDDPDPDTQEQLRWNPEEDTNWDTKDMGAVMGTNVRDICDLVDGMQEGDRFEIIARDGFKKEFAYKNVYEYDPDREGPMVLCWYKDEMYPDSGYEDGMRLVWFAAPTYKEGPTSIEGLPSGNYHVFGNWDWHEAADPEYWYYYQGQYPTTTGLSVQNVSRINIYTSDYDELAIPPTLTADNEGNKVGQSVDIIFADDAAWRNAIIGITVNGKALTSKQFSVTEGNIKLSADVFSAVGEYNIVVQAIGYSNATVKQKMEAPAPEIPLTIVVKENGVETQSVEYNLGEWEELERQHYSIRDSMPAYRLGAAEGVYLEDILNAAEINIESINGFKFVSTDKESFPLSKSELFDVQRYYYPNIFLENKEEGAQVVKPMLALKSYVGSRNDSTLPSWDSIDDLNTIRLFVGQKNVEDINYGLYAKWICEIEVELAEPSQPVAVTGVSITESNQELEVGKTVQLSAVVEPEDATNKNVTWSSDDETVATVSATGLVTTVAKGTATITVTTEDGNKTAAITVTVVEESGEPTMDVLYQGTVILTPDETFTVTVGSNEYTINGNTPLGALQAAAEAGNFTYVLSDKRWSSDGVLLLDDVGVYKRKSPGYWYAYVNDVYKDGYQNTPAGLNIIELVTGDRVEFYYAVGISDPADLNAVKAAATAAVKTVVALSTVDVLYDGTVNLDPEEEFTVTAYNSETGYTVNENTPLGALHKASIVGGFTYDVTDKNYGSSGALLLDNVADYDYVNNGSGWYAYVNGALKDGYNNPDGALNLIQLADGDKVEFYYADVEDETDFNAVKATATAAVKITVVNGVVPTDWTLQLSGARDETVTKAYFEQGLACSPSHHATWTDDEGNVWGGMPLWLLVAMVDDNPDKGNKHFNFNDEIAAAGYDVKVIAGDGWSTVLDSADIAHSDAYIIANTLNGEPLPLTIGDKKKGCWPLHLKGSAISGGQQVGNIVRIELSGLPEPPVGWTLEMIGDIGDTITQEEFEEALACTGSGHYQEWTDNEGNIWSGVPLWVLLGAVDDIEQTGNHWTFDADLAADYTVKVVAGDGFSKTLDGVKVANSNDYIVANKCNGEPLTGNSAPLRLVGDGVTKEDGSLGNLAVGNIARIEIPELQTPPAAEGSWNLSLKGKITDVMSQAELENGLYCPNSGHLVEWTDGNGDKWSGMPLWLLAGWVDDRKPHSYDFIQASAGYKIVIKAEDGYSVDFDSKDINKSNDYIVANKLNDLPLTDSWPLRLVGPGVATEDGFLTGKSVGSIVEIKLTSFETGDSGVIPDLHIVKYGEDGVTIIDEVTINYLEMQQRFDVIGDGTTVYKYQGITNNPDDIWSAEDETVGGFKIENAIMGTRVSDLVSLVGGMGTSTDIIFVAKDGWETTLPYSSIYPDPSVYARQGDAIIAWYADGKYVPDYKDGMRLFFTPEDMIYGQWDMHETLPEAYWHYYYSDVMYPSCAGLSAKYITEIKVYSVPQGDWTLELDGLDIGGLQKEISKTYFESALTCTFGANHKASYTDSNERTWEGMPLWLLVGFVDDADQHSDNAFNEKLAQSGSYEVVITASDGASVTINSTDIDRNNNYIVANSLNGNTIPESDENWPLRLVGPNVSGKQSIGQIVSIKLVPSESGDPAYTVSPVADAAYTVGTTPEGISTMTVNSGIAGFKYFTAQIEPRVSHSGQETVVFTHLRNGSQLQINSTKADFDVVDIAQAGFNVQAGDVIKVFIVDELTNAVDHNPVILQ